MNNIFKKNMPHWVVYVGMGMFFSIIIFFWLLSFTQSASAQFTPFRQFGGKLLNTDFETCTCGFAILTIDDDVTHRQIKIIYFWLADLIKKLTALLDKINDKLPDFLKIDVVEAIKKVTAKIVSIIPVPTVYMWYNIFTQGVNVLGQYVPAGGTCFRFIPEPPYCVEQETGAEGYLWKMGTSLIPSR